MSQPETIDVLVMNGESLNVFIAHGLQLDVAGQGNSISEALDAMQFAVAAVALRAAECGVEPQMVEAATQDYWERFDSATPLDIPLPAVPKVECPGLDDVPVPKVGSVRQEA